MKQLNVHTYQVSTFRKMPQTDTNAQVLFYKLCLVGDDEPSMTGANSPHEALTIFEKKCKIKLCFCDVKDPHWAGEIREYRKGANEVVQNMESKFTYSFQVGKCDNS